MGKLFRKIKVLWLGFLSLLIGMRVTIKNYFAPSVTLDYPLKKQPMTWLAWGLFGLTASVFFFITTNLAVWWTSGMYPLTQEGLVTCFVLAIPFFHNSVLATWIFLAAFEGARRESSRSNWGDEG